MLDKDGNEPSFSIQGMEILEYSHDRYLPLSVGKGVKLSPLP
jgi:hypothetical protein